MTFWITPLACTKEPNCSTCEAMGRVTFAISAQGVWCLVMKTVKGTLLKSWAHSGPPSPTRSLSMAMRTLTVPEATAALRASALCS
ncbi:hypothetical protein D3C86_1983370 [compost metagenome]